MTMTSNNTKYRVKLLGINVYVFIISFGIWYAFKTTNLFYLFLFSCVASFFLEFFGISFTNMWLKLTTYLCKNKKMRKKY